MEEQSNSNGKVLLALLGGVALGAILGILFAPEKGSETRKKMVDKAKKAGGQFRDKIKDQMSFVNGQDDFVDIA